MRLLLTTTHWGVIGGTERYAAELVPLLAARGHRVTLLAERATAAAPCGVRVLALAERSGARPGTGGADAIARLVRAESPDAVLVLSASGDGVLAALERAVEPAGTPLVRFVQDHVPFCPGLNKLRADGTRCRTAMGAACLEQYVLGPGCSGYRRAHHAGRPAAGVTALWKHLRGLERLRRARRVLVASEHVRRELLDLGLAPEQVVRLPYFAPRLAPPGPLAPGLGAFLADGAPLLLTASRLAQPDKGVDLLLAALSRLRQRFRCVVAGAGPAEGELRARARELGLEQRVHFAGWLGEPALAALYARARAVVVPSAWDEPFGLVGLEAMRHARAVAAFAVGGIPEWLGDGVTGRLVAPRDTDGLARVLERWLADPAEPAALGRAGRTRLEREFTAGQHLDRLEAALRGAPVPVPSVRQPGGGGEGVALLDDAREAAPRRG